MDSQDTQEVKVLLNRGPDGAPLEQPLVVWVEARRGTGEAEVSNRVVDGLRDVLDSIQAVAAEVADAVRSVRPDKFTVELGFEMKGESGGLVAMLVRAGGTASVTVTMEWERDKPPPPPPPPPPGPVPPAP